MRIGAFASSHIAAQLYLGEATVKASVSRLLTKLDAANRVQIAILVHDADLAGAVAPRSAGGSSCGLHA
jgi:hypothetical protein